MRDFLPQIGAALDSPDVGAWPVVEERAVQSLPSVFAVSDLACASIAAATSEVSAYASDLTGEPPGVVDVDRRLASIWFAGSIVPDGWQVPPAWDAVAGDYEAADGWLKLHTNAPHHRAAALRVLGVRPDRDAVAAAVSKWSADELESAVVEAGGAAAAMRSISQWKVHPNGSAVGAEPLITLYPGAVGESSGDRVEVETLSRTRPLAGIRVLDLTRVLAGPVATRFLAGWGADVLRIDPFDWFEDGLVPEVTLGKRCARLDLKTSEGLDVVTALLEQADVVVHGYRPDALERLGLGAERRQQVRPGLVDVSLDAFGWTGPWALRRGFDSLVQMSSGIADAGMAAAGADRPKPLPVQALDHAAGYLMAAAAVRGLRHRNSTGVGAIGRLSLARTAALLIDGPPGRLDSQFDPVAPDDVAPDVEATPWGPAHRVKSPMTIDGKGPLWLRPATTLGSHPPAWS
ncbi:MAG: CoA transferase [Acidimicrobiales bacterium]